MKEFIVYKMSKVQLKEHLNRMLLESMDSIRINRYIGTAIRRAIHLYDRKTYVLNGNSSAEGVGRGENCKELHPKCIFLNRKTLTLDLNFKRV